MATSFVVNIDGGVLGRFAEVSGLKGGDLVLKRGVVNSRLLTQWIEQARSTGALGRKTVVIQLLAENGTVTQKWRVTGAWPTKAIGPGLSAVGNDVAVEEVGLSAEGIVLL